MFPGSVYVQTYSDGDDRAALSLQGFFHVAKGGDQHSAERIFLQIGDGGFDFRQHGARLELALFAVKEGSAVWYGFPKFR